MKKIKVLFTIPNFITAGSGREMFNIIEGLDKNVFDPFIAVRQAGGSLYDEAINKGYTVLVHPFTAEGKGVFKSILTAFKLSRFFRSYQFDIWQSFNWSSDFTEAVIARLNGAKYVYVKKNMNWGRKAWNIKNRLSAAIVARNKTMLQTFFASPHHQKKIRYITGAVDTKNFFPKEEYSIRQQYNIPADVCLICCVGQLVRVKDQVTLIKAVAEIPGTYLLLVGAAHDEIYKTELEQLVAQLGIQGHVLMPGRVADINSVLNACDIFVLPTSKLHGHEEGCPVSLLEAMAAGIPCIASNIAGNNDLIVSGETGLLFEAGNVTGLKGNIEKYIADPAFAKRMAGTALEHIKAKHTIDAEVKAFEAMYKKMLS